MTFRKATRLLMRGITVSRKGRSLYDWMSLATEASTRGRRKCEDEEIETKTPWNKMKLIDTILTLDMRYQHV